jgi:hypothetical protein
MRPNPSLFPPNGYQHEAHGRIWKGANWGDVARQIENHRRAVGHPVGKPLEEIYEAFCNRYPSHCQSAERVQVIVDYVNSDVAFGQRVVAWVANTATRKIANPASGDLANARAEICKRCPEQADWKATCGCAPGQVEKVAKVFFTNLGHGPSPDTNGLHACRALGEDCRLSVWMNQSPRAVGQPGNCWRLS